MKQRSRSERRPVRPVKQGETKAVAQSASARAPAGRRLPAAPRSPKREDRRALGYVGGAVDIDGEDERKGVLAHALDVASEEASTQAHVHGFHSYAARMHPVTAQRLVRGLGRSAGTLLDPFCGSGTVLVEARLAGQRAIGVDANPLGVELAWLKTRGFAPRELTELEHAGRAVAEHAEVRRLDRAGPTVRYGQNDRALYEPHTLLELDGLRDGIRRHTSGISQRALLLVLSSLLTKVSRQPGDTAGDRRQRRLASGFAIRLFMDKTTELLARLAAFRAALPAQPLPASVRVGDARVLDGVRPNTVDCVVTSPPYPGVYDYHEHHAARIRWLGLDGQAFQRSEVGSRRRLEALPFARALGAWESDLLRVFETLRRVLVRDGVAALVLADTTLSGRAVYADMTVARVCPRAGLELVGRASQRRPHFHREAGAAFRDRPRREHVLLMRRVFER